MEQGGHLRRWRRTRREPGGGRRRRRGVAEQTRRRRRGSPFLSVVAASAAAAAAAPPHGPGRHLRVHSRSNRPLPPSVSPGHPAAGSTRHRPLRFRGLGLRLGPLAGGLPRRDLRPELRPVSLGGEPPAQPQLLLVFVEGGERLRRGQEAAAAPAAREGRCRRGCRPSRWEASRSASSCRAACCSASSSSSFPPQGPGDLGGGRLGCGPGARGAPRSGHFRLLRKGKRLFWRFPAFFFKASKKKKSNKRE